MARAKARFQHGTPGLPGGNPDPTYTECAWSLTLDAGLVRALVERARAEGISKDEMLASIVSQGLT